MLKSTRKTGLVALVVTLVMLASPWLAPTAAQADEPLRIGVTIWPGWMPWWIVEKEGYFKKVGVNAEIVHFKRYPDGLAAFNGKKLDGYLMILADVIVPASHGVPGRVVLITDESSGADGILAAKGIDSVAGFKGKRVAYEFGGVSQLILTKALQKQGMTLKDITPVNMAAEDAGTAFMAGAVQGAVTWEPYLSKAVQQGKGEVVFSTRQTPGLVPDLLAVRQETIDQHRADVLKVLKAWRMALDFLKNHREEALKIMADGAGITPEEMAKNLEGIKLYSIADNIAQMGQAPDGPLFRTAREQAKFLKANQFIDTVPDVDKLIDPSFMHELGK